MEGIGVGLQSIGAILIAYSQFQMNRTISLWLQTLDMTVDQMLGREDIVRVRGLNEHWNRDLRRDKWMTSIGWILFVLGEGVLLGHFLQWF